MDLGIGSFCSSAVDFLNPFSSSKDVEVKEVAVKTASGNNAEISAVRQPVTFSNIEQVSVNDDGSVKSESTEQSWFSKAWDVISSSTSKSIDAISDGISHTVDAVEDAVLTKGVYRFASIVGSGLEDIWYSLETTGENLINGEFREAAYSGIIDVPFNFVKTTALSAGQVTSNLLDNTITVGSYMITGDAFSLGVTALTGKSLTQHALSATGNITGLKGFNRFSKLLDNPILSSFNYNDSYAYIAGESDRVLEKNNFSFNDYFYNEIYKG